MRAVLLALALIAAAPALAQIRAVPEAHILRDAPAGNEGETTAVAPPVNLRPTQLLRCPDGKGGISLQDTPCRPAPESPGTTPAGAQEVTDLSALPPRPQVEAPAPRVDEGAADRRTRAMLYGAGKLALLLAACYGVYRLVRYARDRFRERFPPAETRRRVPRRVR